MGNFEVPAVNFQGGMSYGRQNLDVERMYIFSSLNKEIFIFHVSFVVELRGGTSSHLDILGKAIPDS